MVRTNNLETGIALPDPRQKLVQAFLGGPKKVVPKVFGRLLNHVGQEARPIHPVRHLSAPPVHCPGQNHAIGNEEVHRVRSTAKIGVALPKGHDMNIREVDREGTFSPRPAMLHQVILEPTVGCLRALRIEDPKPRPEFLWIKTHSPGQATLL